MHVSSGDALTVHERGVQRGHLRSHEGVDAVQDRRQIPELQLLPEKRNVLTHSEHEDRTVQNTYRFCVLRTTSNGLKNEYSPSKTGCCQYEHAGFPGGLCMDILTNGLDSRFLVTNMGWHSGALCGTLSPSVLGPQPPHSLQELTVAPARISHSRAHRHTSGEGIWLHVHVCEHTCTNEPLYMCARVCVYCACVHTCTLCCMHLRTCMHVHARAYVRLLLLQLRQLPAGASGSAPALTLPPW